MAVVAILLIGLLACALWLPIFPSKWYYFYKTTLQREVSDVRAGTLAQRTDGYLGLEIDKLASKAGIGFIRVRADVVYFVFYSDPVQSKGILCSTVRLLNERTEGPSGSMSDINFITSDDAGYWYSFVSE